MSEQKPEAPLSLPLELTPEDEAFLVATTGIQDPDALRDHILQIREDAMKVFPYPCIWRFDFASSHIQNLPRYDTVLALAKQHPDALLLDIGCGFGQDVRRLVLDGYPPRNIIASDLRQGLWDMGHRFFRSDPATFPVKFIQGDILDPTFTSPSSLPSSPFPSTPKSPTSLPSNTFTLIHASYLFHLFPEATQRTLAHILLSLLAPTQGSMILGTHIGRRVRGTRVAKRAPAPGCGVASLFCHSVESWREMWGSVINGDGKGGGEEDEGGDGKGEVEVEVRLVEDRPDLADEDPTTPFLLLQWAVIRR